MRTVIEDKVPRDAKIVDYTWKYVNKDGSPDKRFKDNRKLPICLYGSIHLLSGEGLDIELRCSNPEITFEFAKQVNG